MENRIIIIGGGPAGITTAVQLRRCGHDPLLIERGDFGGLLLNANLVENYPGFPNGISGVNLSKLLISQMEKNSVKTMKANVIKIERIDNKYKILTDDMRELYCEHLVIATGTKPKRNKTLLKTLEDDDREIFYSAHSLFDVFEMDICIIGGSDAAFDYAMSLSVKNNITILVRGRRSSAVKRLREMIAVNENVKVLYSTEAKEIKRENRGLRVVYRRDDIIYEKFFDYVLFAIGRKPEYPEMIGFDAVEEENLYLTGDVKNGIYRQLSLSVADGMKAAMEIDFKIRRTEIESH